MPIRPYRKRIERHLEVRTACCLHTLQRARNPRHQRAYYWKNNTRDRLRSNTRACSSRGERAKECARRRISRAPPAPHGRTGAKCLGRLSCLHLNIINLHSEILRATYVILQIHHVCRNGTVQRRGRKETAEFSRSAHLGPARRPKKLPFPPGAEGYSPGRVPSSAFSCLPCRKASCAFTSISSREMNCDLRAESTEPPISGCLE